jgi:mono/diheme cytochrome c family protein
MRSSWIGIGVAILLAAGSWFAQAEQKSAPEKKIRGEDALVHHGRYLVGSVGMCGDCHTPP